MYKYTKRKKQSFRHHETFVINRFVWNRSISPWTSLPSEAGKVLYGSGVQNLLRNIFGAKLNVTSRNFNRAMKYWLKMVDIPRHVELDGADNFSSLDRTWLDADNLWIIVYPRIMKINAGDHACPGNVGMQRTEWDQIGIISCSQSQVYLWSYLRGQEETTHTRQDWDWNRSQTTWVLFVIGVSGLDQHERMKIQAVLIL